MKAAVLRKLILLGSFHYALRQKEDQTARYLSALRNPTTQILGHPQGRIYNYRAGLNADWSRALRKLRASIKPWRSTAMLIDRTSKMSLLKIARQEGVRIFLGTDAHHPWQLPL